MVLANTNLLNSNYWKAIKDKIKQKIQILFQIDQFRSKITPEFSDVNAQTQIMGNKLHSYSRLTPQI